MAYLYFDPGYDTIYMSYAGELYYLTSYEKDWVQSPWDTVRSYNSSTVSTERLQYLGRFRP